MTSRSGNAAMCTSDGSSLRLRLIPCSPVGGVRRTDATSNRGAAAAAAVRRNAASVFMSASYDRAHEPGLNAAFSGRSGPDGMSVLGRAFHAIDHDRVLGWA